MATQSTRSMVSEVSICNQALSWLAQKPIISLDQASTQAEWMRNNYPFIRDALLESRKWTFAKARAVSTTADLDAWGVEFKHPAPLGWLKVCSVFDSPYQDQNEVPWRLENNYIITDVGTIYLTGILRGSDTGSFSAGFVQALAARLAADACIPMTENRQLQGDLWTLSVEKLREAAAVDGMQGTNDKVMATSLIDARRSGRYT